MVGEPDWTRLRWGLAGATAAGAAGVLLLADGRSVEVGLTPLGLAVSLLWALPLALYAALVRTRSGTVLVGLGLAVATAALLQSVYSSDGSTAAIGVVVAPIELALLAAVGAGLDACGQSFRRRRAVRTGSARRGP